MNVRNDLSLDSFDLSDLDRMLLSSVSLDATLAAGEKLPDALRENSLVAIRIDVEFARVLCSVLEEELVATAFTHTDGDKVEVDCKLSGPTEDCFNAVEQLTLATVEAFKKATKKIGGIEVQTNLITNKKSYKDQIGLKTAQTQHRKFLHKFI